MTRRSAVIRTRSYLSLLKSEVLENISNGISRVEVIAKVRLLSFSEDRFYKKWHSRNVASVYDELMLSQSSNILMNKKGTLEQKVVEAMGGIEKNMLEVVLEPKSDKSMIIKEKPKLKTKLKKLPKKNIIVKKEKPLKSRAVQYRSFSQAVNIAKTKNKIVLIKVRSTVCKYCDQLDRVMRRNSTVKKLLNKYFELVKINTDYEDIPMSLTVRSTPTLIFIQPDNKKLLMKLAGIRALGELLEILNEAVDDGHNGGYLKP
jgi:thioredoxin-related protein